MTRQEVAVMLGYFKTVYRNLFPGANAETTISVWYEMFVDEPTTLVRQAMKKYVIDNKYPPAISELLELVEKEKWELYSEYCLFEPMDDSPREKLPKAFYPRNITRQPKAFAIKNDMQIKQLISSENARLECREQKLINNSRT